MMAPTSEDLSRVLDQISEEISRVEEKLHKMPGASEASVELEGRLDEIGECWYLETMRDPTTGRCRICVRDYSNHDETVTTPLTDFHVSLRIKLFKFVPDLLDSAISGEEEVARQGAEVLGIVQQRLATLEQ